MIVTNKPLAAPGLMSYRYKSTRGWIMIGAKDDHDALREAQRSLSFGVLATPQNLERWDGNQYISINEEQS